MIYAVFYLEEKQIHEQLEDLLIPGSVSLYFYLIAP